MTDRVQAPASEGVGMEFPERQADCGGRPSWYPFQVNVCDVDDPELDPLPTDRHRELPEAQAIPWSPA